MARNLCDGDRDDDIFTRRGPRDSQQLRRWLSRVEGRFFGVPLDVSPHEAIMQALRVTAGEVVYCDQQIARLTEDELFERPTSTSLAQLPSGRWSVVEEKRDAEEVTRWVRFRQSAVDRMAKYAKLALDAGIDERVVALAEHQANQFERYLSAVLEDIELTPEQRRTLGPAMRRNMKLLESSERHVAA